MAWMAGTIPRHDGAAGVAAMAMTSARRANHLRFLIDVAHDQASRRTKSPAPKNQFLKRLQPDSPCPVPPQKISRFRFSRNQCSLPSSRARSKRGVSRSSRTLNAGCGGRNQSCSALFAGGRTTLMRTAKPCGPGIPTLMPSLRRRFRVAQVTGATKPGPRGELGVSRKPLRREGRLFGSYLWFLPRAFSFARGPWVRSAPGLPCAL
jgi:hypothetical protein